jgi:hypothetical protein
MFIVFQGGASGFERRRAIQARATFDAAFDLKIERDSALHAERRSEEVKLGPCASRDHALFIDHIARNHASGRQNCIYALDKNISRCIDEGLHGIVIVELHNLGYKL